MAKKSTAKSKSAVQGSERPSALRWWIETVLLVLAAVVIAQVVRMFIVESFIIPTGSMIPTIELNDRVLGEKITYRFVRAPKQGEIVVFDNPEPQLVPGQPPQRYFIKRVIATGGQTVQIQDGKVLVDGKPLDEPYVHGQATLPGPVNTPLEIPAGSVWLMGDNRNNSADSRYFGAVPVSTVRARAFWTYWPISRMRVLH